MPRPRTTFECEGIGTHWWFELLDHEKFSHRLQHIIIETIDVFNQKYSRFLDESYVGRLNREKSVAQFPGELYDMMQFARHMHEVSDGAFNISAGGELHARGYGSRKNSGIIIDDFWQRAEVTRDKITIPNETIIDLGGFGKGWLIDKLAKIFRQNGYQQFTINGGGDLLVSSDVPVKIALEHPTDATMGIGSTPITHGALGVSSTIKRRWQNGKVTEHHIIDPTTSAPSDSPIMSTYVKADTALIADTMATILLLRPKLDKKLCKEFGLQTILLRYDQLS